MPYFVVTNCYTARDNTKGSQVSHVEADLKLLDSRHWVHLHAGCLKHPGPAHRAECCLGCRCRSTFILTMIDSNSD